MAIANRYVVLYFTNGPYPSEDQMAEAREYGPHVMYRNTRFIGDTDGCEPCTAVAGEVPRQYRRKYPQAVSYADWIAGKLPTPEIPATPGEIALGQDKRSFASRVVPSDAPARPPRSSRAGRAAAMEPDPALTGTDSLPPPPPAPRGSLTGAIDLPPPPPPPEG